MPLLIENISWMIWNLFLAILPVIFAFIAIKYFKNIIGFMFFILWVLFFPNSIYLVTDIQYLPNQLTQFGVLYDFLLIIQYSILIALGVITYFYALRPIVMKFKIHEGIVFIFNFMVGFAVVLGKIQRTQSWDVILNPLKVISDIKNTIYSPQLVLYIVILGIAINFIWFYGGRKLKDLPYLF